MASHLSLGALGLRALSKPCNAVASRALVQAATSSWEYSTTHTVISSSPSQGTRNDQVMYS